MLKEMKAVLSDVSLWHLCTERRIETETDEISDRTDPDLDMVTSNSIST